MTRNLVIKDGAQRNEDIGPETWRFTDNLTGAAIDITGWLFEFRIALATGLAPVLTVGETPNGNGSYFRVSEAADGRADRFLAKEDIAALPGFGQDLSVLAFNLIATDSLGFEHAYIVGPFIVPPGV